MNIIKHGLILYDLYMSYVIYIYIHIERLYTHIRRRSISIYHTAVDAVDP